MEAPDADCLVFFFVNLDCAEHQRQTIAARALTALHLEEEPSKQAEGGREGEAVC